jgi:hypothetical protein
MRHAEHESEAAELESPITPPSDGQDLTAAEDAELLARHEAVQRGEYIDEAALFAWLDAQA